MSTNSSAWIRFTTLGGTGGKLDAKTNGMGVGAAVTDGKGTLGDHTVDVGGIGLLTVVSMARTEMAVMETGSDVGGRWCSCRCSRLTCKVG